MKSIDDKIPNVNVRIAELGWSLAQRIRVDGFRVRDREINRFARSVSAVPRTEGHLRFVNCSRSGPQNVTRVCQFGRRDEYACPKRDIHGHGV